MRFENAPRKKCEKNVFWKCTWKKNAKKKNEKNAKKMWKNAKKMWKKCEKMWKKCEKNVKKMWKNAKKCEKKVWKSSWEGGTLISSSSGLIFFGFQFCCSYFAACPTSAGWKSERSSSNRSEVDCADRRSVKFSYSKTMTTRSKT